MSKHSSALKVSSTKLRAKNLRRRSLNRVVGSWIGKGLDAPDICPAKKFALLVVTPKLFCAVLQTPQVLKKRIVKGGRQKRFPGHNRSRALQKQAEYNLE